jgi:uncharacterized protein (DUF302 family)
MNRNENIYCAESEKSVTKFVEDFADVIKSRDFVLNNPGTMNMKATFSEHGGQIPDDFDLYMLQICKPTKADKSLAANRERAVLMPKFVHVFSAEGKTQIRYMSYSQEDIAALVPGDANFPESLEQTFTTIQAMIDEAR